MKKAVMLIVFLFLLVVPLFVLAESDDSCSGWFGWMKCFFGFAEEKGALVGNDP